MEITREFVREKWIPALRSGDYAQGSGRLRQGHTYCCLGVAADRLDPNAWGFDGLSSEFFWNSHLGTLGEHLGLSMDLQGFFWFLNDNEKRSFSEIADVLETMSESDESWESAQVSPYSFNY